jgi:hypothetical protein
MEYDPWAPEPPAPTRLYWCHDYPRRVRAASAYGAAAIVARYLARKRYGRTASYRLQPAGWKRDNRTGEAVGWYYRATILGRQSRISNGRPLLGSLDIFIDLG